MMITFVFYQSLTMTVAFSFGGGSSSAMLQRVCILLLLLLASCDSAKDTSRSINIVNRAGFTVDVYWINRWKNDELVLNTEDGILNGASTSLNTFVTHEFQLVEVPSKKSGKCRQDECRTATCQVNANTGQIITLEKGLEIKIEDDNTRARDQAGTMVQECKAQFANKKVDPYRLLEELSDCIQKSVNASLDKTDEEKSFQASVRERLGERLEQYQCLDGNATQTKSIENTTWTFEAKQYPIKVLMDRPSVRIMVVEGFISPEECKLADEKIITERVNTNGLSAKKGGMPFPAKETDHLYKLGNRIYSFAEETLKVHVGKGEDREDLFLLHYEPKSENSDHYEPHCDGTCDGSRFEAGDRIATMILYCVVPEVGGATHFSRTGSHIPGKVGEALFYSYVDPKTGIRDTGMTNHTGCPVIEGEKKVLTHKIRLA